MAIFENVINDNMEFPVEVFVSCNQKEKINSLVHWHDCFELQYILNGRAKQIINEKEFEVKKGDIIFIKSGDIHTTFCEINDDTNILVIKFMPSIVNAEYSRLANSKYIAAFLNSDKASNLDNLEHDERNILIGLLDEIFNEFEIKKNAYEFIIKGDIYKLIANAVRFNLIAVPNNKIDIVSFERMQKILSFIEQRYMLEINLEDISKMLNMNYSYTSRYFKSLTGKTFKEYLDYIRICEADKLLIKRIDSIYNISSKCGFSSQQAFNRVYKRLRGYSPRFKK